MNHDAIWTFPPKQGGKLVETKSSNIEIKEKGDNDKQSTSKEAKSNDFLHLQKRVMENAPKSSHLCHKPNRIENAYILIQFNILIINLIKSMSTLRL